MGTTLDEGLHNLDEYTCVYGPTFYTYLHTYPEPIKFLALLSGRSFCVDIDNSTISYYFGSILFFFFNLFIQFTQVLVTWSLLLLCAVAVKVDLNACEDGVKVNYFRLILS